MFSAGAYSWLRSRLAEKHGGPQEGQPKAVRRFGARGELRLEQGSDEKPVFWQFYGARLLLDSSRADAQTCSLELFFIVFVHAVVAVVLFGVVFASADRMQERSMQDIQALVTRGFRAAFTPVGQRARKRRDHVMRRAGIVLRAVGVGDLQNIARIL